MAALLLLQQLSLSYDAPKFLGKDEIFISSKQIGCTLGNLRTWNTEVSKKRVYLILQVNQIQRTANFTLEFGGEVIFFLIMIFDNSMIFV